MDFTTPERRQFHPEWHCTRTFIRAAAFGNGSQVYGRYENVRNSATGFTAENAARASPRNEGNSMKANAAYPQVPEETL